MFRNIYNDLLKWKKSPRRKPLMLTGVRQCGKTFIVNEFGKKEFNNMVTINFESASAYSGIFDYDLDVNRILLELERVTKQKIVPGETLLFFDEIQECPMAITSLKYFCENMKGLHVICAGSLLGIALKKENISFPVGKVNRMQLYPMNFKEFVIAAGEEDLIHTFEGWPIDRLIPELYSGKLSRLLKDYYIVGGMPEAVNTFLETKDYNEVENVQKEILRDYADDFSKHAPINDIPKIRWVWDSVPVQIAKDNNKFVFSHVKEGKRSRDLEDALQWLKDAGLVSILYLVEKPEIPISSQADKTAFKVYMSDVGLLRCRLGLSADTILDESAGYSRYKGAYAENYIMNELISMEKEAYYWHSGNSAELDFIFEDISGLIPVEVKAADNTQAKSFRQFCKKYSPQTGFNLSFLKMRIILRTL